MERYQKYLRDEEIKRLRVLKIQGLVSKSYDENEKHMENRRFTDKPYIAFNSLQPIFNENPKADTYRAVVVFFKSFKFI